MKKKTSGRETTVEYHLLKASEGGLGQRPAIFLLRQVGIIARPRVSYYIGHTAVEVTGTKRQHDKASRVLFDGY